MASRHLPLKAHHLTKAEYLDLRPLGAGVSDSRVLAQHELLVRQAFKRGSLIPLKVLAEYPEMQTQKVERMHAGGTLRFQFMREPAQQFGDQLEIRPLRQKDYEKFVEKETGLSYSDYCRDNPLCTHFSLHRVHGGNWAFIACGARSELTPQGLGMVRCLRVISFKSQDAREWGKICDQVLGKYSSNVRQMKHDRMQLVKAPRREVSLQVPAAGVEAQFVRVAALGLNFVQSGDFTERLAAASGGR